MEIIHKKRKLKENIDFLSHQVDSASNLKSKYYFGPIQGKASLMRITQEFTFNLHISEL